MKKMVLIEIKHCIDRAEYKVVFIALMILNIASYILCVKNDIGKSYQFIRSANENFVLQGTEAAYIPYIMYLLLPVYATIIASLSLIREEKSNSSILLIQRIGKKKYLAGKLFGILIVTFLTITIPMLINLLLCHCHSMKCCANDPVQQKCCQGRKAIDQNSVSTDQHITLF